MWWMLWFSLVLLVNTLLFFISVLFSSMKVEKDSNSAFECGFDHISSNIPYHFHFFGIGVLFLVFDLELAVSLPLVVFLSWSSAWNCFWVFFMLVLLVGLFIEVLMGTLDWKLF